MGLKIDSRKRGWGAEEPCRGGVQGVLEGAGEVAPW
jgi:hypothetical protein